jgi:UDP-N-acetylglucosamine pyrophosphorylase
MMRFARQYRPSGAIRQPKPSREDVGDATGGGGPLIYGVTARGSPCMVTASPPIAVLFIMSDFDAFEIKMRAAGMGDAAVRAFQRNYQALVRAESGMIPEQSIRPVEALESYESIAGLACEPGLFDELVVIKLNGGLGTSMGLTGPKSLLPVRDGLTFLDLMVRQILELRRATGASPRLLLMNSFSTSAATLAHLERYRGDGLADPGDVELMQNQIPKVDAATLRPAEWPADPALEWCPPGHGDLFPALVGSGWLDRLLDAGVRYAFVSNSDNLGAVPDAAMLAHFAGCGAPFLMEVTRRTAADRKGGHLAVRSGDGRLLLREVAQCPEVDLEAFQDICRHRYFNTNSLWLRLDRLRDQLAADDGVLPLPMIRNRKNLDPRDPASPLVEQLEVAMGAAVECFEGAAAIEVPRSRFAPVKTTSDLLALRSDAYAVLPDGRVALHPSRRGQPPDIRLSADYKLVDSLDALGAPGLLDCRSLEVSGPVRFAAGVRFHGDVRVACADGRPATLDAGDYRDREITL